ncbi:MAG TPA: antibiotic biosynthesis monooxygenase [Candidatus Limnocylindria bacterium]|nr:antibiotic biosynthesis monooxygenase [Candidatus Limnocylindria bacterium]
MMVRVLIERHIRPGVEQELLAALREMRGGAVHAAGYVSGETLRDVDDPGHYVIISTWRSRGDWDRWAVSEARQHARRRIAPLLASPERVSVLEPA